MAAKEHVQAYRHIVDHNHPPGAPINIAELPPVKPKLPSSKASVGEMCKRVRILKEWAHRMELNHIPLMELEVPPAKAAELRAAEADPTAPLHAVQGTSKELMQKFLEALSAFQLKHVPLVATVRTRDNLNPDYLGEGGGVPKDLAEDSGPLIGLPEWKNEVAKQEP